jgi:hypothetical protein
VSSEQAIEGLTMTKNPVKGESSEDEIVHGCYNEYSKKQSFGRRLNDEEARIAVSVNCAEFLDLPYYIGLIRTHSGGMMSMIERILIRYHGCG